MEVVVSQKAPSAIGPYSQAIKANGMVFCSGQLPMNLKGEIVDSDIEVQTERVLENLSEVLLEAGSGLDKVVKTTVYLDNMDDFPRFNEVYASFFSEKFPARATVEVSRLPKDVLIEIDCIATLNS